MVGGRKSPRSTDVPHPRQLQEVWGAIGVPARSIKGDVGAAQRFAQAQYRQHLRGVRAQALPIPRADGPELADLTNPAHRTSSVADRRAATVARRAAMASAFGKARST